MNSLNFWTAGAVPGTENSGGILTQVPVLVSGDARLYRVRLPFRENVDGSILYAEGKPVVDVAGLVLGVFTGFKVGDFLATNGIMNTLAEAVVNGAMQSGRDDFVQFYNPTHGFLGDLIESTFDVLFGAVLPSGISRQMRDVQQQALDAGVRLNNVAHSQGGLILMTALRGVDAPVSFDYQRAVIQISGAPFWAATFHEIADQVGYPEQDRVFQANWLDEYILPGVPITDPVSDLLGGNFLYDDKGVLSRFAGAVISLGLLFGEGSPHSNYACWVCGDDIGDQGLKIRNDLPVPVFMMSDGLRR